MSIGNTIHFLQVPYAEKDEAKALGARWNAERKQWYYYGEEDGRFEKWTPTPVMQLSDLSEEQQSMIALAKTGMGSCMLHSPDARQWKVSTVAIR